MLNQISNSRAIQTLLQSIAILRAYSAKLRLAHLAFLLLFISIMILDKDRPNSGQFLIQYYILISSAIITYSVRTLWSLWASRVLVTSLAFQIFFWLTPLWTGGMDQTAWIQLAKRSLDVHVFVVIVASVIAFNPKGLRAIIFIASTVCGVTAAYSVVRFLSINSNDWHALRLVTYPWPNENTGPAVFGIILAGLFFYALSLSKRQFPRHVSTENAANLPRNFLLTQRPMLSFNAVERFYLFCVCSILLLDIFLAGTRAVLIALGACLFFFLISESIKSKKVASFSLMFLMFLFCSAAALIVYSDLVSQKLFRGFSQRDELFVGFLKIAAENFWLGHGIQNDGRYIVSGISAPHNQLLTALLYGGFFGAVLLATLYVRIIIVGIQLYRRTGSFALISAACFVVVHGFFETVIFTTTPDWRWILLWLPVGVAAGIEIRLRSGD